MASYRTREIIAVKLARTLLDLSGWQRWISRSDAPPLLDTSFIQTLPI